MQDPTELTDEQLWDLLGRSAGVERFDCLMEMARRSSQRRDHEREMTLLAEAEDTAVGIPDEYMAATARYHQGFTAFGLRDYAASADRYAIAAEGFSGVGKSAEAADALWGKADALRVLDDYEGCLDAAGQSRVLAESEGESVTAGDACLQQARALYMLDREQEALEACRAAREHFRSAGMPQRVAQVDDFALNVNLYLGNLDEALELARGCLVLARESSADTDDPYAERQLAETYRRRDELPQALHHADAAKALYRGLDDLAGVARCEKIRGQALEASDDYDGALDAYTSARVLFDATGWDYDALQCDTRAAITLHGLGEYERAARINERLVAAFAGIDEEEAARWSAVRLIDNLYAHEMYDLCLEVCEDAAAVWPDSATTEDRSYREFLGLRAAALAETGNAQEATVLAERVIRATPARDASASTALCYEIRGRSRIDGEEAAAAQDFARAIALHLARGNALRAMELSRHFLPVDESTPGAKSLDFRDRGETGPDQQRLH
jgi:tetratricopeptide (TPR) repeat protein